MNLEIRQTRDGSHTLCNVEINKTFHSIHGAINESVHVFIRAGLDAVLEKKQKIKLLEVGFGTGLNALLTLQRILQRQADDQIKVYYTCLEPFPIPMALVEQLNYAQYFEDPALYQSLLLRLHQAAWEEFSKIEKDFLLEKKRTTLENFDYGNGTFDLIYFDPFPPSAHPHLWEIPWLDKIAKALSPGGVFTTYCAKGQFKRNLKSLGLIVQSLPGPPGKREMIRAVKP
jgi:tRNA U34 5-methylaminomethyl-2-thiouridine-forming methyltransferase MnmC